MKVRSHPCQPKYFALIYSFCNKILSYKIFIPPRYKMYIQGAKGSDRISPSLYRIMCPGYHIKFHFWENQRFLALNLYDWILVLTFCFYYQTYGKLEKFYKSTLPPLPNQNILPVWGYIYNICYMQKLTWLGKGGNAVQQPKMQTFPNKICTLYCTWQYETAVISGVLCCNWVQI